MSNQAEYTEVPKEFTEVPIALLNATRGNTDIVLHHTLIFRERLCFEKLQRSWYTLISAWPILWARIRRNASSPSGLVFQIPGPRLIDRMKREASLSTDPRKQPFYCLDEGNRTLSSLYTGVESQPSGATSGAFTAVAPSPQDIHPLVRANSPVSFNDCLKSDLPLISMQVTRLADATLITLNANHIYGDGFLNVGILKAWQGILNGDGPPAPLQDLDLDPFAVFNPDFLKPSEKPPPPPRGYFEYGFFNKMQLIGNFLYDSRVKRPEANMQQRYVFLPRKEILELEKTTREDLKVVAAREGRSPDDGQYRVGRSDIIYAWLMKNSHAGLPRSWISTPLSILNFRRSPPPGVKGYPQHPFFGAAFAAPLGSLKIGDLLEKPIGELALHVRRSHESHMDGENMRKAVVFTLYHDLWKNPSGQVVFFCPPNHRWSGLSDWRALRIFSHNFGGALMEEEIQAEKKSAHVAGQLIDMTCNMSKRDRWVCMGDSNEGTWMSGFLSVDQWNHPDGFGRYGQRLLQPKGRQSKL